MADDHAHHYNPHQVTAIEVLPDDVLLAIFDFCVVRDQDFHSAGPGIGFGVFFRDNGTKRAVEWWQPLVHVCRRWRVLVFGSPRRLNLQLRCTLGSVTGKTLDVWPALPLLIMDDFAGGPAYNLTSVLEHSNRIRQINLMYHTYLTTSQIEEIWAAMQVPFPELTVLVLVHDVPNETAPVLPGSLLGGLAPRLRSLTVFGFPFPGLQNLFLSATHLVELHLWDIPHSAYISPEMVTCLSASTSLERLSLGFKSPQSRPDRESGPYAPPPSTRSVLPTLTGFWFKGVNEYLEDLLARIDAPRLYQLWIIFLNDIDFDTPEFIEFIGRTLTFESPNEAHVAFNGTHAWFNLQPQASNFEKVKVTISCGEPDWQFSALAQICTSLLPFLSATESLYIYEDLPPNLKLDWDDGIENTEWLEFLFPFTTVKNLYLSREFGPRIAPTLQELTGGRMTEVLPTLQNIFLEGFQPTKSAQEGIGQFISGRQLTNHPITISSRNRHWHPGHVLSLEAHDW